MNKYEKTGQLMVYISLTSALAYKIDGSVVPWYLAVGLILGILMFLYGGSNDP